MFLKFYTWSNTMNYRKQDHMKTVKLSIINYPVWSSFVILFLTKSQILY